MTDKVTDQQFPQEPLKRSVQKYPKDLETSGVFGGGEGGIFTFNLASAADLVTPWGQQPRLRDQELRDFFPQESYLAGAIATVCMRNAAYKWEIRGESEKLNQSVTDMLLSAMSNQEAGWSTFMQTYSLDLYTQDNGSFIEIIRSPGKDVASRFKNENAPVIGINHLDAARCVRTGNPETPVVYWDRNSTPHKLKWYDVIPTTEFPSAIEDMYGVGYSAVTRVLRIAQIIRSMLVFKDEKISGRRYRQIHFVGGVSRSELDDVLARGKENASNQGLVRYIDPAIMASLDPEKPVSTASLDIAGLPDGFDLDQEMKWYLTGLALGFGVDYMEFAPLPGGNIGSSEQSSTLQKKTSGKGPALFMRKIQQAFKTYGVLPADTQLVFDDQLEQEMLERQEIRTSTAEEMAILLKNGVLTPDAARKVLEERGLYSEEILNGIPDGYGLDLLKPSKQMVGARGGDNTAEDAKRNETGKEKPSVGDRLRKVFKNG